MFEGGKNRPSILVLHPRASLCPVPTVSVRQEVVCSCRGVDSTGDESPERDVSKMRVLETFSGVLQNHLILTLLSGGRTLPV